MADLTQAPQQQGGGGNLPPPPPDDADDLRGANFNHLLRRPAVKAGALLAMVVAGLAGAYLAGPLVGAAAALGGLALALLAVFAVADSRAEQAFFTAYAGQRGMQLSGRRPLAPVTPLLRKGDERYAERMLRGPLADGVQGTLALYTYEEHTTDSRGNRQESRYRFTITIADAGDAVAHVPELYCQRRSGLRSLERLEDVFRGKQRVKLESEALDRRYEIFALPDQDAVWLRRLFSPSFIVWLCEQAPEKFAFELCAGVLVCSVPGHKDNSADLDALCRATAAVVTRLREEALE